MQRMDNTTYEKIRQWMYRNARPLDLAKWQFLFEDGSAESVLQALAAYQNEDGGFSRLDSDSWNPNSSPYNTKEAFDVLRMLGLYDPRLPLIARAFAYLDSTGDYNGERWQFTVPSNNEYPRAPWWSYSEEVNEQNGYHATGGLAGFILRCGDRDSAVYAKALRAADGMVTKMVSGEALDMHEVSAFCPLLSDLPAAGLAERYDIAGLQARMRGIVDQTIERDSSKWMTYGMRPSFFIDSPQSTYYPGNEEIMGAELDFLINTRNAEGVWDITWAWAAYPKEFAISERWWQGFWAVRNMLLLRIFDRISE